MRRVEIFARNKSTGWVCTPTGEKGIFHQFGIDHIEYESGPGMFTTAVVEMDDGTVRNIQVELIKFLDKE